MATDQIGPLQLIVMSFSTPDLEGRFADEINKLNEGNVLRLVDAVAVTKDQKGKIASMHTSQISMGEAADYGAYIGKWIDFGSGDTDHDASIKIAANFNARHNYGLTKDDVRDIATRIPNGWSAVFVLVEHLWAKPLRDTLRSAGGVLLAEDFLTPEALIAKGRAAKDAA
jgi:uncharacterized membrane protein